MENTIGPLGQKTCYVETYDVDMLFPVPRTLSREKLGLQDPLPFHGIDIWNGTELSWLNPKGKPVIAMSEFYFPYNTRNIVESKSLKLYLNSFNQSHFESIEEVQQIIERDLSAACEAEVSVILFSPEESHRWKQGNLPGICLDDMDISTNVYARDPFLLKTIPGEHEERTYYSNLLRSRCMATGQPDWGSVMVKYQGHKIDPESLLKYIISYRSNTGFAEHCVEQIYCDLMKHCAPEKLSVYARYTRRGGLDINPFRSNWEQVPHNLRQTRQ